MVISAGVFKVYLPGKQSRRRYPLMVSFLTPFDRKNIKLLPSVDRCPMHEMAKRGLMTLHETRSIRLASSLPKEEVVLRDRFPSSAGGISCIPTMCQRYLHDVSSCRIGPSGPLETSDMFPCSISRDVGGRELEQACQHRRLSSNQEQRRASTETSPQAL